MTRAQLWAAVWVGAIVAHIALIGGRTGIEFAGSVASIAVSFGLLIGDLRDFWRQP